MKNMDVAEGAITTEERIKNAAREVFLEKGCDGATTRDIAERAGMNRALMNYYFRSKEKLFNAIFEEELKLAFKGVQAVLATDLSLKEKIIALIDHEFNMMQEKNNLAIFILRETPKNPELYIQAIEKITSDSIALFAKQVEEAVQANLIRPISGDHLMNLMRSISWTLFTTKPLLMHLYQLDEPGFRQYADEFKRSSTEILIHGLFLS